MTGTPAKPRLSATILLLRDAPGLEVLMVQRHYEIDFASGALVFPGGKTCEDDERPGWSDHVDGGEDDGSRAVRIAAIRELFEEAGILLARPVARRGAGQPLVGRDIAGALDGHRGPVDRGEASFLDLVRREGLVLACDALVPFGHWVTPEFMPKRFDTYFFLAHLPDGQTAEQDGRETTEAVWLAPGHALEMERAGEAVIIFPTRMNLGRLALAASADEALDRFSRDVAGRVLPVIEKDEDGTAVLVIPDIEGYGQTREPIGRLDGVMKGAARPGTPD